LRAIASKSGGCAQSYPRSRAAYGRVPVTFKVTSSASDNWSAVPVDVEAHRVLLNRRLSYVAKVYAILSVVFYIRNIALIRIMYGRFPPFDNLALVLHTIAALLAVGTWLITRGRSRSLKEIGILDAVFLVGTMCLYGALTVAEANGFEHSVAIASAGAEVLLVCVIMVSLVLVHAIIVPLGVRQMFLLSFAACAVGPVAAYGVAAVGFPREVLIEKPWIPLNQAGYVGMWAVFTTISATIAARVIHGLKERVRKADELGQYRLEKKIGEGGMGVVYLARHALLRRPTAVKLLHRENATENAIRRFEKEVQLTSALTHPNTIAIFDFGRTADGVFYYAMEYLDGVTLEELVKHAGAQPPGRVVHILAQVCGALDEAHTAGLTHRDIKPANLMLTRRGSVLDHVKVLDFGLVKEQPKTEGIDGAAAQHPGLSIEGTLVGTPAYLPPEAIINPAGADGRSDLYSLGAVAYFLLTGKLVFEGTNLVQICAQHLHHAPTRPSERVRGSGGLEIPKSLEDLVLQCLEKDPSNRPSSAAELGEKLLTLDDVAPWTSRDRQSWWDTTGATIREASKRDRESTTTSSSTPGGSGPKTVAIDRLSKDLSHAEVPTSLGA
jgi:eukaryotic-like serine/threonine-protein kinase